ncbi:MAG: hypothetical protein RR948_06245 [Clostridium sp.]|uniref:hypothetical protein n=1 Tax=Clostridium sp. TaxID=1506 RepID=UPI003071017D
MPGQALAKGKYIHSIKNCYYIHEPRLKINGDFCFIVIGLWRINVFRYKVYLLIFCV